VKLLVGSNITAFSPRPGFPSAANRQCFYPNHVAQHQERANSRSFGIQPCESAFAQSVVSFSSFFLPLQTHAFDPLPAVPFMREQNEWMLLRLSLDELNNRLGMSVY
jgi:hypothetical protein